MNYIVYKTTNLINKKIYIGAHKQESTEFDGYFGSGHNILSAIKRYGKENFIRETLFVFDNEKDAFDVESLIVDSFFISRPDTYNLCEGGGGNSRLGQYSVENKIGIHALSFEERSKNSKTRIKNTSKEKLLEISRKGGLIGGKFNAVNKTGFCKLATTEKSIIGRKSAETHKKNKTNFFSTDFQREMGKRSAAKRLPRAHSAETREKMKIAQQFRRAREKSNST